jgi:transcriptional regulator with XRE-family HTH domain
MAVEGSEPRMTDAPLHAALADLLRRRGMSLTRLGSVLRAEGLTIGRTRLYQIASGDGPPASAAHMERLAAVLGVSPSYFAEYRLWRVRALLDPACVGFERAMENLRRLNGRREVARIDPDSASRAGEGRYPARSSEAKERA